MLDPTFKFAFLASFGIFCLSSVAVADELKAATKGKSEPVHQLYGVIKSFDGTILTFEVPERDEPGQTRRPPGSPQTIAFEFKPSTTEVDLWPNINDPQAPIDQNDYAMATKQETHDVGLRIAQAQQAAAEKQAAEKEKKTEQRDLTKCKAPGKDQIIEKGPSKTPVRGQIGSIKEGFLTITRSSDKQTRKYRLDDLVQITLGSCSLQ
jgi:hypothetical protein